MANEVLPEHVRDVRDKTSAPLLDCKKALQESKGDIEKAVEILRVKGISKASKINLSSPFPGLPHAA